MDSHERVKVLPNDTLQAADADRAQAPTLAKVLYSGVGVSLGTLSFGSFESFDADQATLHGQTAKKTSNHGPTWGSDWSKTQKRRIQSQTWEVVVFWRQPPTYLCGQRPAPTVSRSCSKVSAHSNIERLAG